MDNTNERPDGLLYGANERPPFGQWIGLAFQYFATSSIFLLLTVLVVQQTHAPSAVAASIISLSMMLTGLSAILQSLKNRFVGSAVFAPATPNPAYLASSLLAVKMGGLPLLGGMTIFASLFQALLSPLLNKLKRFFPPELGVLLVCMIGFEIGTSGVDRYAQLISGQHNISLFIIGIISLIIMHSLHIWGKGIFKIFSLLIGIIVGYAAVFFFGKFNPQSLHHIASAPWFFIPKIPKIDYQFFYALIIPFMITGLVCAIKVTGSITALQQMQSSQWKGSDFKAISRASYTDAMVTFLAGLCGCLGFNISSSAMALSVSTGVCSRYIAYPYAAFFIMIALCPKISYIFIYTPGPVIASSLIYLSINLLISSFKALGPLMTTPQKRYIVGLALMFGLSYEIYPMYYNQLPTTVRYFTGSSIALAILVAVFLNFIFMLRLADQD
jgi:xanthine permease XanP